MKVKTLKFAASLLGLVLLSPNLHAALMFDQNVTNEVIFGSGNANGGFTVDQQNGIELGLRAKLRFDNTNQPQNTFNSNGDGTYSFDNVAPPTGFGFAPGSSSTAIWNFEFSINSNFDGSGGSLNSYLYWLSIDFDPSAATQELGFDPINLPDPDFADHAIGSNATGNGAGSSATDRPDYLSLIAQNNLAQNSWNMEFFDGGPFTFNNTDVGVYDFTLTATDLNGNQLSATSIQVLAGSVPVPEPAGMALFGLALAAIGLRRRSLAKR